ncbi:hypothetical protein EW093_02375 [Thiospirochaeta perfilievii]|uniref:Tetratricopeptide repeat protein n=1 Tax=Thiospirochaeta perfilievii TaxID=252967 RepID=A0A5C1Q9K7_9SPIO|nr:hypothetical protein [Thiospirochaeta perfilievii]QEN03589.1 hypothetical protein EW093_02375 [Thiospirochaeta perfilievii]
MSKRFLILLLLSLSTLIFSQDVELNRINALDEFKWGVKFYNQGLYEKSVFSFERSLSYDSLDLRTHLWLGQAYFMKGDVEAALGEWSLLQEKDEAPIWLDKAVEIISARRGVINRMYSVEEWVTLYSKDINRASSVLSLNNGDSIIVSFMDGLLTKLNSNGAVIETYNGGFEPFDKPFDIIESDNGGYIVSEFMGDRISFINDLGIKIKSINPNDSPLSGPGFLSKNSSGYFYVSDWGNRRVCKFDMDGNLILSIINENLKRPTGVLAAGDEVYIADSVNKTVLLFDESGNYIKTVVSSGLDSPEGLSFKDEVTLLIADGVKLKEFNLNSRVLSDVTDLQGKASRITKGVVDVNGNTLTTDFNLGEFYSLTDISSLYGGLYVVIDRVSSINFPKIDVELQVYNRLGEPIIGLDNSNFLISENNRVVGTRDVVFKGSDNNLVNMSLLIDLDSTVAPYYNNLYDISKAFDSELIAGDRVSLITAGEYPEVVSSRKLNFGNDILEIDNNSFIDRDGIDLSIKLAASTLIPSREKREIVLVTTGVQKESDFVQYSLNEINDLLINNRISLSIIYLEDRNNPELDYIVKQSGGSTRYLFDGPGTKGIITKEREKKSGFYVLSFDSLKNIDNGEQFTTVEVEIDFIRKSGRSESGYFVPVKVLE